MSAMLVFQNNETAAMLMFQTSYVKTFFCSLFYLPSSWPSERKRFVLISFSSRFFYFGTFLSRNSSFCKPYGSYKFLFFFFVKTLILIVVGAFRRYCGGCTAISRSRWHGWRTVRPKQNCAKILAVFEESRRSRNSCRNKTSSFYTVVLFCLLICLFVF